MGKVVRVVLSCCTWEDGEGEAWGNVSIEIDVSNFGGQLKGEKKYALSKNVKKLTLSLLML